jgi:hypothetical protein
VRENRSDKLVRELLALYAKYGAASFQEALSEIESGRISELISRIGRASTQQIERGKTSQRARQGSVSRADKVSRFIVNLRYSNDERKRFVGEFAHQVLKKNILVNGRSLATFGSRIGVDAGQKIDRVALIQKISDKLLDMDFDIVKEAVEYSKKIDNQKSSLQEWSKVIVKDGNS